MAIEAGATAEVQRAVTPEMSADVLGNPGVRVLATPMLICLLENAASAVMTPHLPDGAASVGTAIDIRHLAATPLGMTVRARATLVDRDGKRFRFRVEAFDDVEKIAEGYHDRHVIGSLAKFLGRVHDKGARQ